MNFSEKLLIGLLVGGAVVFLLYLRAEDDIVSSIADVAKKAGTQVAKEEDKKTQKLRAANVAARPNVPRNTGNKNTVGVQSVVRKLRDQKSN